MLKHDFLFEKFETSGNLGTKRYISKHVSHELIQVFFN
jgi:hypothetical protein